MNQEIEKIKEEIKNLVWDVIGSALVALLFIGLGVCLTFINQFVAAIILIVIGLFFLGFYTIRFIVMIIKRKNVIKGK